ncbi:hypothetical protein KR044_008979, partial [Drosophila immigrans]
KINSLQNFWRRFLIVEPVLFLFVAPNLFSGYNIGYFSLNKVCRFNLGYNEATCNAIRRTQFDNDCLPFQFGNITTQGPSAEELIVNASSPNFQYVVCKAESLTYEQVDNVYLNISKIAQKIPYIMLLFFGGWADRYNKRKAVMILPIVGRCLSNTYQLLASIFFKSLPFEWSCYTLILSALFGDEPVFMMSAYSYITTTTPENDRILRLGIFAIFCEFVYFVVGNVTIFNTIGYSKSYAISALLQIAAILYIVLFIKDPKPKLTKSEDLTVEKTADLELTQQSEPTKLEASAALGKRNVLRQFFDPTLVMDLIKMPFKRRDNNGSLILLLLNLCFVLTIGPKTSEQYYFYDYAFYELNWDPNLFNTYNALIYVISSFGAFLGAVVLSKMLKFSDSMVGIWAAVFTVVSRLIFGFASDTKTFLIAEVFNLFDSFRIIPIKAMASTINVGDGKLFSFYGILETIAVFSFPHIYDAVYYATINSFRTFVFLFSEIFYVPIVAMLM